MAGFIPKHEYEKHLAAVAKPVAVAKPEVEEVKSSLPPRNKRNGKADESKTETTN